MDEKPNSTSADHKAMADYWRMVETILGGAKAMRAAGETYLPKFEVESQAEYDLRRKHAKFTNVYRDIVENLAQRPFGTEVAINDDAPPDLTTFAEDVDGRGNNLHVFAGDVFFAGINAAIDWIMVDYTKGVPQGATRADEARLGARPYWVRYPASSVLAAYSAQINGREEFVHVRLSECVTERSGFKEVKKDRVRVLNREETEDGQYGPATYEVWEKQEVTGHDKNDWIVIEGPTPISIGIIPMVPFLAGRRIGQRWQVHPPMRDAADLQIDLYQQENALKNAKEFTAFPMLSASGVDPQISDDGKPMAIAVGPKTVLYGGAATDGGGGGSWEFIEPSASSLSFLADDIKDTIKELRELGRQPLTAQSGNLTVVTTAFAAQKGNSAIQAWALNLKDALERALQITALWLRIDGEATVTINTDFDLGFGDDESFAQVIEMYRDGTISREQLVHEAKRRGIIDRDYDGDVDLDQILKEMDGEDAPRAIATE
jgi:hypothetical protein